jgi:hypothetical protein
MSSTSTHALLARDHPVLISIPDFIATEPFGRTKTYELIDSGELQTVYSGKRRLIVADSYRRYVEKLKAEADGKRNPSPNPKAKNFAPGGHPLAAQLGRGARGSRGTSK